MKNRENIYLDFDGTVIDVWERYFQVFFTVLGMEPNCTIDEYRTIKKALEKDSLVAQYLNLSLPSDYYVTKRKLLEEYEYLKKDKLLVANDYLEWLFDKFNCCILTKRRNRKNFYLQLDYLKLGKYARNAIIINPDECLSKLNYIQSNCDTSRFTIIGDSREELALQVRKDAKVVLVTTGLFDVTRFSRGENCYISESLNSFIAERMEDR